MSHCWQGALSLDISLRQLADFRIAGYEGGAVDG